MPKSNVWNILAFSIFFGLPNTRPSIGTHWDIVTVMLEPRKETFCYNFTKTVKTAHAQTIKREREREGKKSPFSKQTSEQPKAYQKLPKQSETKNQHQNRASVKNGHNGVNSGCEKVLFKPSSDDRDKNQKSKSRWTKIKKNGYDLKKKALNADKRTPYCRQTRASVKNTTILNATKKLILLKKRCMWRREREH